MNQTRLTNFQLLALTATFSIGSTVMAIQSGISQLAKQDAWISALIASAAGLGFVWMYYTLGKLYPGKTLIDIFRCVFGKWIGWIISAFFVIFFCLLSAAQVVFYMGDFKQTEYMTETPLYALNLLFVILLVLALMYGLEAIARSSEIFIFVITCMIAFAMLADTPNIHPHQLLPVLENGFLPVIKGSIRLSAFLTWPIIILLMIYPINTEQGTKAGKSLFWGYLWASAINLVCTIMATLVLGPYITESAQYPIYLLAQEINLGIISRIEGVVSLSWILTAFIRALMYFYAGVLGMTQLFGLKDYKKYVIPLGIIILVYSGIVYPDTNYQATWDSTTWIAMTITFSVVLPIIMLIISLIKKKLNALK